MPVVATLLCLSGIVAPVMAQARAYDAAPPLPAPSGTVVNVSTESELQNAVRAAVPFTTIVIAPGTYNLTGPLYLNGVNDVTLRGATNNRDDVVLAGRGMTNSAVEFGIWTNGQRITIANLTVRDVSDHAVILNGGAQSPRIYNVHLIDTGQQFVKSNPDGGGGGVNNGIVEYSVIEYSTTSRDAYTNGVDVHTGSGWVVRHNLFRNIAAPAGLLAGPAVLIWNGSSNAIVEGNTFVNCQREVSLGLTERTPDDNTGGVVRNNFISRAAGIYGDAGILVADSPGTQVLHNTVLLKGTYAYAIEYRFAGTRGGLIANNLTSAPVQARDGATGTVRSNYEAAKSSMFVNAAAGDLHLLPSATAAMNRVGSVADAPKDWDKQPRPTNGTADYGADEFDGEGELPPSPPPSPSNQPPQVSITSPASGTTLTAPASIELSVQASDNDGAVSSVSFYNGSTLLGSDASGPYTYTWANVPAGTYTLAAVAVDNGGASTTSSPVIVTVGPGGGNLPSPWATADIGAPTVAGSAAHSNGTFTVAGGGMDIWGNTDQFRFVYRTITGDGEIVARVASLTNPDGWAKAGVMIREQLTSDSSHAFALVTPSNGVAFQRRPDLGGITHHTAGGFDAAPYWLKIARAGSTFSAYQSTDGSTWTLIGTDTVTMGTTVHAGLVVLGHNDVAPATVSMTNVSVSNTPGNTPPTVSLDSPANGSTFTAPASIALTATAADADGSVTGVEFYSGSTLVGSDSSRPFSYTWANVPAGEYRITAAAIDNGGARATSNAASITVTGAPAATLQLVFTPSADHDSNVTSYRLEVFRAGQDPATATAAATQNLGKPAVVSGSISADMLPLVAQLPSGSYIASVTAVGPGGSTRGAPSNTFVR
ncbi:MAG: hypothetical protein GEU82_03430 [Luteitalea sp.]|nr:hypothetical protein [Luteitalea sp.]